MADSNLLDTFLEIFITCDCMCVIFVFCFLSRCLVSEQQFGKEVFQAADDQKVQRQRQLHEGCVSTPNNSIMRVRFMKGFFFLFFFF